MRVTERRGRLGKDLGATAAVIAAAVLCRRIALTTGSDSLFLDRLANFTRIFLYLGLFAVWGVSVRRRVMQTQVRRYLIAVAVLMEFWLTVREFRWHLVVNADVRRFLWYLYYVPLLLIPLLALLVSMSLGRGEAYRLPKRTTLLYVPTAALILLVLTNDLHRRVFAFPEGTASQAALDYRYGAAYYVVFAWGILCSLAAFAVMLVKCRVPRSKRFLRLPSVPFGIAVAYAALYLARVPFVVNALGDLAVVDCLVFTAFFESCIRCGLIQSNTRYFDLFRASVGVSAQITDRDYAVRYAASGAAPFPRDAMLAAETAPVTLPEGMRLHNMPVNGGHVVWTEDISELLAVQEELEDRQEELRDRNGFLQYSYEKEKEHRLVVEQNRLYDLLQDKTQPQLDRIGELTERCRTETDADEKRRILARIVVLGSYIKRRRDFVLSMDSSPVLAEGKLANALSESLRSLELLDIRGGCLVRTGREYLDGETLTLAYDFFERVAESVWDAARYLNVGVCVAEGTLRCAVMTDRAGDDTELRRAFPQLRVERDGDGGASYLLPLEGGRGG